MAAALGFVGGPSGGIGARIEGDKRAFVRRAPRGKGRCREKVAGAHLFRLSGRRTCKRSLEQKASMTANDMVDDLAPSADRTEEWNFVISSPAKINLFLRILRKREDGFHELASLFQAVSLADTLRFRELSADATEDSLECDADGVPTDGSNLVLKALSTFRQRTETSKYFHVKLEKRVPAQAGLGGGSGNAAAALWAANEMCGRPASDQELAEFGAEFGSDISFFLSSGCAYCTGRGEIFEDIAALPPTELHVVKPDIGLSTGSVFKAMDYGRLSHSEPRALLEHWSTWKSPLSTAAVNDLEEPSFRLEPQMAALKDCLQQFGFDVVLMSGSGSSFFCLGRPNAAVAETWPTILAQQYPNVFIEKCHFVNREPGQTWYA